MPDSPIDRLSEDVLHNIFLLLRDGEKQWLSRWVTVGALVSRVSPQWRAIASRGSSLWKDIFLGPTSSPGMTRIVLDRAAKHSLRVIFCIPQDMGGLLFKGFSAPFSASMQLVMGQSTCWGTLSITSPFLPLLQLSKMLSHIPLPQVHSMELIRSDSAATLCCGPFMLNAVFFRHLVLDGVVIRPADSFQFSGLWSLSVANTDLRMLDGFRMKLLTSATPIPTGCMPTLVRIQHLSISAPLLPYIPQILSFNPSTLVSLKLDGLSGTPVSLVSKLLTQNLHSLELVDMDGAAVKLLFTSLHGRKFHGLCTLKIVSTDVRGLESEFEIQNIFPSLTSFQV
ncbi:hypothetical protein H2248_012445 [Termitomyces sp. 'cryptogamus']|nr:hypothetical protein H2248_012445 [Termitomyces sp. 'cryptogamus']